jgi:hypothetical protein
MVVALSGVPAFPGARSQGARVMAAKCQAIARSGSRCNSPVLPASQWCWVHDPAAADRRREASKKGGKARATKARALAAIPDAMTSDELAGWLSLLFKNVVAGRVEPRIGTAAATIARVLMDVREATELEQRLAELESRAGLADRRFG